MFAPWFAPLHNGRVFFLFNYDRATTIIVPFAAANSHGLAIITLKRADTSPTPTDISDLPPTRRAPRAYIHSCPTYRVRGVSPYANRAPIAQAHMDGHHTSLSALARHCNKL